MREPDKWIERCQIRKESPEMERECIAAGIAEYCTKCGDSGNGCAGCRIYDFGLFHGINDPLFEEDA